MGDIKRYSFLDCATDKWNKLSKERCGGCGCGARVSEMKDKLDKCGQRDRT